MVTVQDHIHRLRGSKSNTICSQFSYAWCSSRGKFARKFLTKPRKLKYVFENGLFQISEGTSKLFPTSILQVIEMVHIVCDSWFSWTHESLLRLGIGGPRIFPRVTTTMISKHFVNVDKIIPLTILQKI